MNINLFVSHSGKMVITCHDAAFTKIIEAIELDKNSTMLFIRFRDDETPVELNCPVHSDAIDMIAGQHECAVGFVMNGDLKESFFVPFRVMENQMMNRRASA